MLDPLPVEEELSVVLAGRFQGADFGSEKLVAKGILSLQEGQRVLPRKKRTLLIGTGFTLDGITLFVTPSKLNLETHDVSCGDRLRDLVLGILHHAMGTPSQACGINYEFFFTLPHDQARDELLFRQAPVNRKWSGVLEHPMVRNLTVSGQRGGKFPGENNVSVRPWKRQEHGIMVAVNYNFPIPSDSEAHELPKLASEFLEKEWSPALAFAHRAVRNLFSNGSSHAS